MTAIQELITELKQLKQTKVLAHSLNAIDDCIHLAYAKMEKEQQQIENAFDNGLITENVYYGYDDRKAEKYYIKTFVK